MVWAEDLDRLDPQSPRRKDPFVCPDCPVGQRPGLTFYGSYKRSSRSGADEDTCVVRAHFKLKRNQSHDPRCNSQPQAVVERMARWSKPGVLTQVEGGGFELRLNVIVAELHSDECVDAQENDVIIHDSDSRRPVSVRFLPAGRLTSYISTATHLARYYQQLQEWDGYRFPSVTIVHGTQRIPWRRFFFAKEDYPRAWDVCKLTRGDQPYPKAFYGEIREVYPPRDGRIAAVLKGTRFPDTAKGVRDGVVTSVAPKFSIPESWDVDLRKDLPAIIVGFAVSDVNGLREWESKGVRHEHRQIRLRLQRRGQLALLPAR
jgi:hypothetical protein